MLVVAAERAAEEFPNRGRGGDFHCHHLGVCLLDVISENPIIAKALEGIAVQ